MTHNPTLQFLHLYVVPRINIAGLMVKWYLADVAYMRRSSTQVVTRMTHICDARSERARTHAIAIAIASHRHRWPKHHANENLIYSVSIFVSSPTKYPTYNSSVLIAFRHLSCTVSISRLSYIPYISTMRVITFATITLNIMILLL
jgi:hypothetical protein